MLNFVLCDDNAEILTKLSKMLESVFMKNNFDAQICFQSTNGEEVLRYVSSHSINVLFLDIKLNSGVTGLEIATKIRKSQKNLYIIFTTGHMEYVMLAYKVKTFDYLVKPITMEKLNDTITRLFEDASNQPSKYINLGNNKGIIKQDDVLFIKRDGMKLIFHTNLKEYQAYSSFNKIQSCLPENFIRCHKSYIANVNKITDIEPNTNTILFSNNDKCYIGPKYKNDLMEVINYGTFSDHLEHSNHTQ